MNHLLICSVVFFYNTNDSLYVRCEEYSAFLFFLVNLILFFKAWFKFYLAYFLFLFAEGGELSVVGKFGSFSAIFLRPIVFPLLTIFSRFCLVYP